MDRMCPRDNDLGDYYQHLEGQRQEVCEMTSAMVLALSQTAAGFVQNVMHHRR